MKRVGATTDSLEWDDFGRLRRVLRSGAEIASFAYDGFGRRIRKTTSTGGTTIYVWDGDQIILEADGSGAMLRGYSYYPGTDRPHTVSTPSNAYLMSIEPATGDVNGLIRASDNAVVAQYAYTPWGELEVDSTHIGNSLRWKGLVYDRETGLYYVRARYYDPKVRRFISEDPIGLAGGINQYAFVGADPINGNDPTGLAPMCWHLETVHIGGQLASAQVFEHECSPGILGPWTSGILSGGFGQGSQGGLEQGPRGQTTGSGSADPFVGIRELANLMNAIGEFSGINSLGRSADSFLGREWGKGTVQLALGLPGFGFEAREAGLAARVVFKTPHAARHLKELKIAASAVEDAVREAIVGTAHGDHFGWVTVSGQWIQYRAYQIAPGVFNVGTYFPVAGPLARRF